MDGQLEVAGRNKQGAGAGRKLGYLEQILTVYLVFSAANNGSKDSIAPAFWLDCLLDLVF